MQKVSLNIKRVVIIALMSLCMLSFFALGVFATMKIINIDVKTDINPNMYFSVEIQKNGTTEGNWKKVFDNFNKDVATSTAEFNQDVLVLKDSIFLNFTSDDLLYFRITNYNEDKTLNAKVLDSATATIKSYKTGGTEPLLDGVKYIGKYVSSPLSVSSKTFCCQINANNAMDVEIPIELNLSKFQPRADTQTVNIIHLIETELYYDNNVISENFTIDSSLDFSCTLRPKQVFELPSSITIYIGDDILSSDYYSYNQTNGKLTIPSGYLTDDIDIQCTSI